MGLYNFKSQFVPLILDGTKTHTIRAPHKNSEGAPQDKPGSIMHLYTGLRRRGPIIQKLPSGEVVRQKMSRLLGRFECVKVEEIEIAQMGPNGVSVWVDGIALERDERDMLAWRDGFRPHGCTADGVTGTPSLLIADGSCFRMMMQFWNGRLPFSGHIFHWKFDKKAVNR